MEILSNQFFPKRLTKYAQYGIAAYGLYTEGKKAYDWVQGIIELQRDKHSYTVLIKNSELLEALTKYVVDRESVVDNRIIEIQGHGWESKYKTVPSFRDLDHFYVGEHKVRIVIEEKERDEAVGEHVMSVVTQRTMFKVSSYAAFQAFNDLTQQIWSEIYSDNDEDDDDDVVHAYLQTLRPNLTSTTSRDFFASKMFRCRPVDTVYLDGNIKESLIEDIKIFNESRDKYLDFGIPYRRGYLFHGPPGTGKSSIVSMIAGTTGRNVYHITLNDIVSDRALSAVLSEVSDSSIILLEDVDSFHAAKSRKLMEGNEEEDGVTLSGLLNALDGIASLQNTIIVMTTNHPELLDEALVRPGRIDRKFEIGYATGSQVSEMVKAFTGEDHEYVIPKGRDLTPASLIEIFKSNFFSLDKIDGQVRELIATPEKVETA